MSELKKIKKLRCKTTKVLPGVYDESLSYYEMLCRLKDDVLKLFTGKQDKLTAGEGIEISEDNEISVVGDFGTTDHNELENRDMTNQHPISAITGLSDELDGVEYRLESIEDSVGEIEEEVEGKQDIISDLDEIREGAELGATALQAVPNTYRTAVEQDVIDNGKQDLATVTFSDSGTVNLVKNTIVLNGSQTAVNITLGSPVYGVDHMVSVIFKAGSGMTFQDTAPTGFVIKWADEPTWTNGKVYEIIYRVLWISDGTNGVIISAKWSEL